RRVALVSFHNHGDRSFLDDRFLALLSGDLRAAGVENELHVAILGDEARDAATFDRLVALLEPYDTVVYERVWSRAVVADLRERLPGRTFIHCRGEHALDDPSADWICT